ncbi:hypothetical protein ACJJTC_010195 [Scirpophaga incertulas]
MRFLVILLGTAALCAGNAVPKDNSHYIEGESRYVWLSQDDDSLVLVDLHERIETRTIDRNGANNQYWLYTRENPTNHQLLIKGNSNSVFSSNFRTNKPTSVIVHGWTNSGHHALNTVVRDALLATQDCNVIVLDWSEAAAGSYVGAVRNVPGVGQSLGEFLTWLVGITGGSWDDLHLIGFSLGAHVVGGAGRAAAGSPARVTGLDPAGPLWLTNSNKLTISSGQYVEGIHTDGGRQGIFAPVGHSDFYPNGGRNLQPGCDGSSCSHARAYQFFASSIYTNRFIGRQCTSLSQAQNNECTGSTLHMGNTILTKQGSGLYGLSTGSSWPF